MSLEGYPVRGSEPEGFIHSSLITGTSGTVTQASGKGLVITRTGVGVYKYTFADRQGVFGGYSADFQSTLMTDVKGFSAVLGAFDSTGTIVSISVYNASQAAADLLANQFLCVGMLFKKAQATL